MAKDDDHIVVYGRKRTIEFAVRGNGDMPAKVFYDLLDRRDRARLYSWFVHIVNEDEEEKIKPSVFGPEAEFPQDVNGGNGKLWAFKGRTHRRPGGGKGMFRIGCFRVRDRWILLDGFWKPPQRTWPETEITNLMNLVREILALEKQHNKKRGE
jgi:hypothetical protein